MSDTILRLLTDPELEQEIAQMVEVAYDVSKEENIKRFLNILARCDPNSGTQMLAVRVALFEPRIFSVVYNKIEEATIFAHFSESAFERHLPLWRELLNRPNFGV